MARDHGRILSAIWSDRDFLALGQEEQRFYMFLLSQPNLNQAGVLPVTVRRWSFAAADLSAAGVERLLAELDRERFVVWDQDTEELLIRTFVRNDKVYRQPKVMLAMVADAAEIVSSRLRMTLLAELDRIPLDEVSSTPPPKGGLSALEVVTGCLETLRRTLFVPDYNPDPPQRETHTERVRETLPETHAGTAAQGVPNASAASRNDIGEGRSAHQPVDNCEPADQSTNGKGIGNPSGNPHAGAGAHSPAPAPAPAPTPTKELPLDAPTRPPLLTVVPSEPLAPLAPTEGEVIQGELIPSPSKAVAKRTRKAVAAKQPDPLGDIAQELTVAFFERHKGRNAQPFPAIRGVVKTALERDVPRDVIAAAMDSIAQSGWGISGNTLTKELNRMWNAANGGDQGSAEDLGSDAHMSRYLARAAARKARGA